MTGGMMETIFGQIQSPGVVVVLFTDNSRLDIYTVRLDLEASKRVKTFKYCLVSKLIFHPTALSHRK
jgi:hypothetical protein